MPPALATDAARIVREWVPADASDREMHASFTRRFLQAEPPLYRGDGADHATASCIVFDATLTKTLLVFHGKGQFWVQPGGHIEGEDETILAAALRELREETGLVLGEDAFVAHDLDHHALSASFGRCASHLDFGVAVIADPGARLVVSDESDAVRWFDIDALPEQIPGNAERRYLSLRSRAKAALSSVT
ncbi:NUDIX hydrolase [Microbacterium amylolyticum]|uniref:8-oxo-dGTP pyrophosphatase MutT (NUDIX family) n=1 Tax=Microbacterium amylolyticum TaxID=936337 RepID=A0ABS4ZF14_9MICO|nr:NUDIX domain-containing protein [Microbacterium amylolyticum]MBP2435877.1 8-oxo-dGTP pyrophosphatase MutT (NUDIX family) [Microbacterium amylolyticum]